MRTIRRGVMAAAAILFLGGAAAAQQTPARPGGGPRRRPARVLGRARRRCRRRGVRPARRRRLQRRPLPADHLAPPRWDAEPVRAAGRRDPGLDRRPGTSAPSRSAASSSSGNSIPRRCRALSQGRSRASAGSEVDFDDGFGVGDTGFAGPGGRRMGAPGRSPAVPEPRDRSRSASLHRPRRRPVSGADRELRRWASSSSRGADAYRTWDRTQSPKVML